jgi:hypothetical protein
MNKHYPSLFLLRFFCTCSIYVKRGGNRSHYLQLSCYCFGIVK